MSIATSTDMSMSTDTYMSMSIAACTDIASSTNIVMSMSITMRTAPFLTSSI